MTDIWAELERVGVTYGKAGAANYVAIAVHGDEDVTLLGPPRLPRRSWRGQTSEVLRRLGALDNDAGLEAFWAAFSS